MFARFNLLLLLLLIMTRCTPSPRYSSLDESSTRKKSTQIQKTKNLQTSSKKRFQTKGEASWYGPGFQGKLTASGEKFNMHKLTAAHRTLPFNTKVEVTNLNNGHKVIVRINDRGPYAKGRDYMKNRIIDVSKKAAQKLGFIDKGTAPVSLRIIQ